jgi:hypothetical protein
MVTTWMTGITAIAISIWSSPRTPGIGVRRSRTMLAIPMLAALTAVGGRAAATSSCACVATSSRS